MSPALAVMAVAAPRAGRDQHVRRGESRIAGEDVSWQRRSARVQRPA